MLTLLQIHNLIFARHHIAFVLAIAVHLAIGISTQVDCSASSGHLITITLA